MFTLTPSPETVVKALFVSLAVLALVWVVSPLAVAVGLVVAVIVRNVVKGGAAGGWSPLSVAAAVAVCWLVWSFVVQPIRSVSATVDRVATVPEVPEVDASGFRARFEAMRAEISDWRAGESDDACGVDR
jgi:hypothetical protein